MNRFSESESLRKHRLWKRLAWFSDDSSDSDSKSEDLLTDSDTDSDDSSYNQPVYHSNREAEAKHDEGHKSYATTDAYDGPTEVEAGDKPIIPKVKAKQPFIETGRIYEDSVRGSRLRNLAIKEARTRIGNDNDYDKDLISYIYERAVETIAVDHPEATSIESNVLVPQYILSFHEQFAEDYADFGISD